jgi:hypothetical protein
MKRMRIKPHLRFRTVFLTVIMPAFLISISARADTTYNDGGIHNISTIMQPGKVHLDNRTTVNILPGGSITGGFEQWAYGIDSYFSSVNVSGGSVKGGTVVGELGWADGISAVHGEINIYSGSVTGGTLPSIDAGWAHGISSTFSTISIFGGSVTGGLGQYPEGFAEGISSGESTINVFGGNIAGIKLSRGTLNINGGSIDDDITILDSIVNIYGGNINNSIYVYRSSVNIYGSGFNYALGLINDASGVLTGTLADGTLLNLPFNQDSSRIIIIPEPTTLILFAIGGIALRKRL